VLSKGDARPPEELGINEWVVVWWWKKLKLLVPPPFFFLVGAAVAVTFESIVLPLGSTGYISRANNTRASESPPGLDLVLMQIFDSSYLVRINALDSHAKERNAITNGPFSK
jgi:hypothetical protein